MHHGTYVQSAVFSPDGRMVVTATSSQVLFPPEGEARVWDAQTGQPISPPMGQEYYPLCAAFSPDGRRVFTPGWNGSVGVWDISPSESYSSADLILLTQL